MLDLALISRLQFAFTISFHIIFPAFSIGLSVFLLLIEGLWLKTNNPLYLMISKFWTKVFALTFGMGVVSGIVMEFQLGANWAGFTKEVGGVLGALFTYEVLTAFFVEAGFLGIMLFGRERVGPRLHCFAIAMVVMGTTLSAYWIICANTWMQHPVGYVLVNHLFEVSSWSDILFNKVVLLRFLHMLFAAYTAAFLVISSVAAFYLLRDRHIAFSKICLQLAWRLLLIVIPIQMFIGDGIGRAVLNYQPIKTAAMESIWENSLGAPFLIFAVPDPDQEKNLLSLAIPHGAALINTHQWNGALQGLDSVEKSLRPPVMPVFYSFRVMVGLGMVIFLMALYAFYLQRKQRLFSDRKFLLACQYAAPLGFIALWCGWITAEMGRQPWIVYQLLKTVEAVSPVSFEHVLIGFIAIFFVYGIVFGFFYFYYLNKFLRQGPTGHDDLIQPFNYLSGNSGKM